MSFFFLLLSRDGDGGGFMVFLRLQRCVVVEISRELFVGAYTKLRAVEKFDLIDYITPRGRVGGCD